MLKKEVKTSEQQSMAASFKAIGHPERLSIIRLLCASKHERLTVKSIYESLKMQQPIASRQLNILKVAGIIKREQEGQKIFYRLCLSKETMETIFKCFTQCKKDD